MGRAPCCDKANVKKGPWSPEEDAKLKSYIEKYGTGNNWIALPQKIGLKRCGKSCRLRWLNYLRPNIKHGGFSEEEDNIICNLYISIGSRWSIIAAQLPGRTDNDIKNYWNTRLKKKLLGRRKQSQNRLSGSNQDQKDSESLSNSALERLQLHIQLQTLQNPFSLYNNPALWPKLNPLQEKMIHTLNCLNENPNPMMQNFPPSPQQAQAQKVELFESPTMNNSKIDELQNYAYNNISSLSSAIEFNNESNNNNTNIAGSSMVPKFDGQIDEFLNNKSMGFVPLEGQSLADDFDCFKEMDGSKDSMIWWGNEFDTNSASSNSWDSTNCVHRHQPEEMYHDYALGYNVQ
ncbi:hypothetical protein LguiA_010993 [Lonicera macranthoides]